MDMEVGNEAPPGEGLLPSAQINSLIVFARDVIRSAHVGTLCQAEVYDQAVRYGLMADTENGFSEWLSPLVEKFDAFERDHLDADDPMPAETEQ